MSKKKIEQQYIYKAEVDRVVDGDTVDVLLDLSFGVYRKGRLRANGIDTPESRTRNLEEKKLGLAAKERLIQLCGEELQLLSLGKGKYGRILGIPHTKEGEDICQILIKEGHAVEYWGGKKIKVWA